MPYWENADLSIDLDLAPIFVLPYDKLPEEAKTWETRVPSEKVKEEIRRGGAIFVPKTSKSTGTNAKDLRLGLNLTPLKDSIPGFNNVLVILKVRLILKLWLSHVYELD